MKNIGILNFHYSNCNYGAVLQAAALQDVLNNNNCVSSNIDLVPSADTSSVLSFLKKKIKNFVQTAIIKDKIDNAIVFEEFRNKWIKRTKKRYSQIENLQKENWQFDTFIVGSDQIWRPRYTRTYTSAYFLAFLPHNVRKIAYAASFGIDHWVNQNDVMSTDEIKRCVNEFNAVSVREDSGKTICDDVFGINATHVLDPTLLAGKSFFDRIISDANIGEQENRIVYYKLDINKQFNDILSCLEEHTNTAAENIYYKDKGSDGVSKKEYNDVPTWLAKIRDSKLVVTDSYHCACFAIIFERPLFYYPNQRRGLARIESLYRLFDIDLNKIFDDSNFENPMNYIVSDYVNITPKLRNDRVKSLKFLLDSINNN